MLYRALMLAVFTSRFSVAAFYGGLPSSSGFPSGSLISATNFSQQLQQSSKSLTKKLFSNWLIPYYLVLLMTSQYGPRRKCRFICCSAVVAFVSVWFQSDRYSAIAHQQPLSAERLLSNGCCGAYGPTCHKCWQQYVRADVLNYILHMMEVT